MLRVPETAAMSGNARDEASQWYEFRNLAPAAGVAALQTAVFGTLGEIAHAAVPGRGIAQWIARVGIGTGAGLVEQQAVDAIAGAAHLRTGYGYIGDVLQGHSGEALQRAAVDAVTFAAFSALHARSRQAAEPAPAGPPTGMAPAPGPGAGPTPSGGPTPTGGPSAGPAPGGAPHPLMDAFASLLNHLSRTARNRDSAAYIIQREFVQPREEGLRGNPNPTVAEARAWFADYPPGPMRDFADRLAEAIAARGPVPEQAERPAPERPAPERPAESPQAPPAAAPAAQAPMPQETPSVAPAAAQEALPGEAPRAPPAGQRPASFGTPGAIRRASFATR